MLGLNGKNPAVNKGKGWGCQDSRQGGMSATSQPHGMGAYFCRDSLSPALSPRDKVMLVG